MARMVRKQILIDEELERALVERATEQGVSQGELVRRTLHEGLLGDEALRKAAWQRVLKAMDDAIEWSKTHPYEGPPVEGRGWTRDDLYDDDDGNPWGFRVGYARGRERDDLPVGREGDD